ncbi:hypothetical protein CB0940_01607 [Cercospora beticola]|uniref:Uncharacterized protein n=1 Tax=Cercospora beticola TaxID=122368 RepID=A0A2G5IBI4_CERBT|nr:hypothetical protein CB0940_01607 [Cercospora beticola]PIB02145.1 hypothetical protein CB0940_01607 [Cercospora beticola]WPA97048.1 hypothetical protein RHO25_001656 [Cercospora beticola]
MFAASTTTSFSHSGTFADNSHYSYTYSYTSYQPSPSPATIPYDAYFSELASRELGRQMQLPLPYGSMNDSLSSFHESVKAVPRYLPDRTGPRIELLGDINEDRIEELSMKPKSSYTGKSRRDSAVSIASSSASSRTLKPSTQQQQQRRKVASRANTYPLPLPLPPIPQPMHSKNNSPSSDTSTSAKRSSKRQQQDWALVQYPTMPSARRSEVAPEDSISQVSSSGRRSSAGSRYQYVPPEERRGRTRTRGETWESVVSGCQQQQQPPPSMMMMQQPVPSGKFETRVITPWD